jgi:hypothetical protein
LDTVCEPFAVFPQWEMTRWWDIFRRGGVREFAAMVKKSKINLAKVIASLSPLPA